MKFKYKKEFDRFFRNVDKRSDDDCWVWTGGKIGKGYGRFKLRGEYYKSHRVSFTNFNSDIPDGMHVLHKCDVPACVNPKHLFIGTNDDNVADRNKKGRTAFGNRVGSSKLTDEDILLIKLWRDRGFTLLSISKAYNVCPSSIHHVVTGKTWRHIQ